jgi:hypothetical protein
MVKIDRSPLPSGISITKDADYRNPLVFSLLVEDAHNKCYLCEVKGESKWEVEHRQSRTNFPAHEHDWTNLFLSCSHCNGIKREKYDDIIDCTIVDPEDYISFFITNINNVTITAIGIPSSDVAKTIELLDKVYNGIGRCMTDFGCVNLRNKVIEEVAKFRGELINYMIETDRSLKLIQRAKIESLIKRDSIFAAFKRTIVRSEPYIRTEFGTALS